MMEKEFIISIIIPVYNGEKYLNQCLDSILAQDYDHFEVILLDDGSEDGSVSIMEDYASKDTRVRFYLKKRENAGAARNFGMEKANGDYFVFIDCDDFIEPDMLRVMLTKSIETDCDICLCDADEFSEIDKQFRYFKARYLNGFYLPNKNSFHPGEIKDFLFQSVNPAPWAKIFRADFIKSKDVLFQSIPRTNDLYFVDILLSLSDKISYVSKVLVHHRVGLTNNLQSGHQYSLDSYPFVIRALKAKLIQEGLFHQFEVTYAKTAIDGCRHIYGKLSLDEFRKKFICYCKDAFDELNIDDSLKKIGEGFLEKKDAVNMDSLFLYLSDLYHLKVIGISYKNTDDIFKRLIGTLQRKFVDILSVLPFSTKNSNVAIYGIGNHSKGLINIYEKLIGDIKSNLVFVETVCTEDHFYGYKVIPYIDLDASMDFIIISSFVHNDEMISNLSGIIDENKIIRFYPGHKTDIFAVFADRNEFFS